MIQENKVEIRVLGTSTNASKDVSKDRSKISIASEKENVDPQCKFNSSYKSEQDPEVSNFRGISTYHPQVVLPQEPDSKLHPQILNEPTPTIPSPIAPILSPESQRMPLTKNATIGLTAQGLISEIEDEGEISDAASTISINDSNFTSNAMAAMAAMGGDPFAGFDPTQHNLSSDMSVGDVKVMMVESIESQMKEIYLMIKKQFQNCEWKSFLTNINKYSALQLEKREVYENQPIPEKQALAAKVTSTLETKKDRYFEGWINDYEQFDFFIHREICRAKASSNMTN